MLWVLVFELVSYGIGMVTRANMGWYDTLQKSALNPPDFVFPVVWTLLYAALAVSGYLCWKAAHTDAGAKPARLVFFTHMILNWGWSFIFFQFHLIALGFIWILGMIVTLGAYIYSIWPWSKTAVWLVIPLMFWSIFAAYLNYTIWVLN